jgi:hypothetical protein
VDDAIAERSPNPFAQIKSFDRWHDWVCQEMNGMPPQMSGILAHIFHCRSFDKGTRRGAQLGPVLRVLDREVHFDDFWALRIDQQYWGKELGERKC